MIERAAYQVLWQSYSSEIQLMDGSNYLYMETRGRHVWNIRNKNTKFSSHKIKDTSLAYMWDNAQVVNVVAQASQPSSSVAGGTVLPPTF